MVDPATGGLKEGKKAPREGLLFPTPDSDLLPASVLRKPRRFVNRFLCRASSDTRIADPSSTNALSFSSARTTKRFPSSRCASTIQIVRQSESIADTQPQLQPALLRLSAMISQFHPNRVHATWADDCLGGGFSSRNRIRV